MNQIIHLLKKSALAGLALAGIFSASFAQPTPTSTPTPPTISITSSPIGGGPTAPQVNLPPPMLKGNISTEEIKQYTTFQQQCNEDPVIKELNAKIAKLAKEIQQLRTEANDTREKLIAANPEIKKIAEKIKASMTMRNGNGPVPISMPISGQGPVPVPTTTTPAPTKK